MLSKEPFVSNDSRYFVYSPSKNAMEMFLYPLQCGQFTYLPGYRLVREAFDSFLLMYIRRFYTADAAHVEDCGSVLWGAE